MTSMPISDTSDQALAVQIELLRAAGPTRRAALMRSMSRTVIELSRQALAAQMKGASEREVLLRWIALNYSEELAERVARDLQRRERGGRDASEIVEAVSPVVEALEALGVPYRIGRSVASTVLGVPRSTLDIDLVCELDERNVPAFAARLASAFYVDERMIRDAIRHRASFNIIHLATMLKVDVFVRKNRPFDRTAFARSVEAALESGGRVFAITTAEDIVIHKLDSFRLGGGVSERQWSDVLGVLRVQSTAIDFEYLRRCCGCARPPRSARSRDC